MVSTEECQPGEYEQEEEPETVHEPAPKRRYHKASDHDDKYLREKLVQDPNYSAAVYVLQTEILLHSCQNNCAKDQL